MSGLSIVGIFLFFLYPIILISISLYASRKQEVTMESYFFANRNSHWLTIGITLLMTCLFTPYFLGMSDTGSLSGMPIIYGAVSVIMLGVLGWYLTPLYLKVKINTLPEFFEKRFNRNCKLFLSSLYVFFNIFIRMLIILIAGNVLISIITGGDAFSSLIFFLVVTSVYTLIGGLKAEIYTNVMQVIFIVFCTIGFSIWVIYQGNSIDQLLPRMNPFTNINSEVNTEYSGIGLLLGLPIVGFWFWCADQSIIQKMLSVRSIDFVKKTSAFSVFLQAIPVIIFILPGIIIASFFQKVTAEETLHSLFANGFLPDILKGGLIIAVASALMSSVSGLFNSTATLITFDFYRNFKPTSSDRKLVLIGRLTTIVLLFCSLLLLAVSQSMNFEFCIKLFKIAAYFSSMVTAVFLMGLINKKIIANSALLTLVVGTSVILLRSGMDLFYNKTYPNILLEWFANSSFLEFSVFIFILCILFLFVFNKLELYRHLIISFQKIISNLFIKTKIKWSPRGKIILILSVLLLIIIWWTLF